jgi:hypothetical protein
MRGDDALVAEQSYQPSQRRRIALTTTMTTSMVMPQKIHCVLIHNLVNSSPLAFEPSAKGTNQPNFYST